MKKSLGTIAILVATSAPAFAHPDDHQLTIVQSLAHLLTQPDHLAMLVLALGAAFVLGRYIKRKA